MAELESMHMSTSHSQPSKSVVGYPSPGDQLPRQVLLERERCKLILLNNAL